MFMVIIFTLLDRIDRLKPASVLFPLSAISLTFSKLPETRHHSFAMSNIEISSLGYWCIRKFRSTYMENHDNGKLIV